MLKFLLRDNYGLYSAIYAFACKSGNLEMLKYLDDIQCPRYASDCMAIAAKYGHLEIIKHLREKGYSWNTYTATQATCFRGSEILKFLHENGCPWDNQVFEAAVRNNNLEAVKYMCENGLPTHDNCQIMTAAGFNSLEVLKFLLEKGFSCGGAAYYGAINYGHFEMLKFLHKNDCPWNVTTMIHSVIQNGDLRIFKYMQENGFSDNSKAYILAAQSGHLHIMKYLRKNSTFDDAKAYLQACRYRQYHIMDYLSNKLLYSN